MSRPSLNQSYKEKSQNSANNSLVLGPPEEEILIPHSGRNEDDEGSSVDEMADKNDLILQNLLA